LFFLKLERIAGREVPGSDIDVGSEPVWEVNAAGVESCPTCSIAADLTLEAPNVIVIACSSSDSRTSATDVPAAAAAGYVAS
jgi:hypothetical protein